ncbi:YeiH family protein [Kutzneria buriramensis]|uniref:Putative integral membrane protein (TIGR00698 family) n=1 Tax=Kutzneria buriramensis TaxID=1045776 RepID=A0A3E0H0E5_9PSEU|nr:putative sulfate exporter family transporter [Kutzneria buriramensis]REH35304.1 putative integral membrane protein (TIGR00698 family) [Kutzneria buriramensis]
MARTLIAAGTTHQAATRLPGLAVALLVAATATGLGLLLPVVGGPVFAIVLGVLAATLIRPLRAKTLAPGYAVASKTVLQLSIVVLGTGLSLQQVVHVGVSSLPVMVGTLAVALGGAWLLGKLLKVGTDTKTLIGVGTGICGASAIAATTAVIKPKDTEVAYAIGTIFTFNIAAVLLFPPLGHLLGLSPHAFGLWAGTAVNDTSSVVAAAYAYGGDAGPYAVVVKLTRSLMIIPIVIALAFLKARREDAKEQREVHLPWHRIVPLFLIGFVVAAATDTAGLIPDSWHPVLSTLGTFLITTALAGIGLSLRFADMRKAGARPLLLGGLLWIAVAASSLGLQALTS